METEQDIKEELIKLKKTHPSANHHCYAYRLGANHQTYRANDDGEPSNSAGKPILGQIQSFNLTNVLVVVVRYFGGTLLGVGGLITAYKNSAALVISESVITEKQVLLTYTLQFNFEKLNDIMKLLKQLNCKIIQQEFEANCSITFTVAKKFSEQCIDKLNHLRDITINP